MNKKRLLGLAMGILILISSCSSSNSVEPTATLWRTSTPPPAATVTFQPQPTLIPTQSWPILSTRAEVACLKGPNDMYERIVTLPIGGSYKVIGKTETFWLIQHSVATDCWVADQQVNVEGDFSAIPTVEVGPLILTPVPPVPPDNLVLKVTCKKTDKYIDEVMVTWTDMSNNEDGFRVYRDGDLVANVSANQTEAFVVGVNVSNRIHYYYVTAYNALGEAKSQPDSIFCKKWE